MELEAKAVAVIYIVGVLLSFVMTGINSLLSLFGVEVVWTTLPGILFSVLVFPFIYGAIIHLIDNFLMGENLDFEKRLLIPIWIVGVVLSFVMLAVNATFEIFGLSLDWSTVPNLLVSFIVFPWVYGFFAHGVDQRLTGG